MAKQERTERLKTIEHLVGQMQRLPMVDDESKARLIIVVEYDSSESRDDLEEVIEKCRERGGPVVADYYRHAPVRESLL